MTHTSCLFVLACSAVLCAVLASEAQEVVKIKPSKIRSGKAVFDYDDLGEHGPSRWGDISPDFQFCKKGQHQSPINLVLGESTSDGIMPEVQLYESVVEYKPSGNNYQLDCNGAPGGRYCSTVTYYGERYHMLQAHFHSPSEHHINGADYPLEMHLVHKSEKGDALLVLGILFKLGNYSEDVQLLFEAADAQGKRVVQFPKFLDVNAGLCTYEGSLTTPPCTEGVHWLLSNHHPVVSLEQVGKYRAQVQEKINNRPVQPVADPQAKCYLNPKITGSNPISNPADDNSVAQPKQPGAGGESESGTTGGTDNTTIVNNGTSNTPVCFPSSASVVLENGERVRMTDLRIGHRVSVGQGKFSPVYAFSHRDPDIVTTHVRVTLESGRQLTLSPGHHLPVNDVYSSASQIKLRDYLRAADGTRDYVTHVSRVTARGLFNPHTVTGTIAVDDVMCSTYTTAVESDSAQALLAPLRLLYRLGLFTERTGGQFLAFGDRFSVFV